MTQSCLPQGASLLHLSRSVHWLLIAVRPAGLCLQPHAKVISLSRERKNEYATCAGHHCSARAKRLLEDVQQLGLHAAKLVKAGDETTARKTLEVRHAPP